MIISSNKNLSLYVHYPFCKSKCPYCDFNSHVRKNIDHQAFLSAYLSELEYFSKSLTSRKIKTIFFGGGTPSLMPVEFVDKILKKISKLWVIDKNCEISLEANPTSFEADKFKEFKNAGINRLSIGIQALNNADLKFLGREHDAHEAINTINLAQKIFDNYSFDLIYARPNQSLDSWQKELNQAIKLSANHLSLYQLTIEKGTKFYSEYQKNKFILPNEDLAANFYQLTNQITADNNLNFYEISNYAKKDFECQHNLAYWQSSDYLGIGAGAHSRVYFDNAKKRSALMMIHEPISWLKKVIKTNNGLQNQIDITQKELLDEIIIMALRTKMGINKEILLNHQAFVNSPLDQIFDAKKLSYLIEQNFIELDQDKLRIKNDKFLMTNQIILKILQSLNFN